MIYHCPHCGYELLKPLKDGLALCPHCKQVFESNLRNRLLSASWSLRKTVWDFERFSKKFSGDPREAEFIFAMVVTECFSHDEVLEAFKHMGITEKTKKLPEFKSDC